MFTTTLKELQLRIHTKYDTTDTTPPETDSDDWLLRTELANDAIETWEQEGTPLGGWAELYQTLAQQYIDDSAVATAAMKTWVSGTYIYDAPTNFVRLTGYVFVTDANGTVSKHEYIRPEKVQRFLASGDDRRYAYVTGNRKSGYKIHIMGNNYASGAVIDYPYYKTASPLSAEEDIVEMSNPRFVFLQVLADLFAEDDPDRSAQYANEAIGVMETMKLQNIMALEQQRDRTEEAVEDSYGFGG